MPIGELRMMVSDNLASLFVRIVDYITDDSLIIAHEAVMVRRDDVQTVRKVYDLAISTGIVSLANGDCYRIVGAEIGSF